MNPTQTLAAFIAGETEPPAAMIHEAKRTLVNTLAVSLSAAPHRSVQRLAAWARAEGASERASVIGSDLRTSPALAALVNGFAAHLQDYDDTHYPTVLHPSAPVWPAVLAAAEEHGRTGRETLVAFAIGAEVACRLAMSVHPWHYDQGWHITGTTGVLGAAAGAARLLRLSEDETVHALGLAGTQASGVREVFGSDGKAMHCGKAASNGYHAATLAAAAMTGPEDIIGGRRGFWAVLSPNGHSEAYLGAEKWELGRNGLKPYANGAVSHPIQDAVIALRNEHGLRPEDVTKIEARVCPLVLELMNRAEPRTGLEAKFSFQHCAAAALVDGAGHDAQFADERVVAPDVAAVRARVMAVVEPSFPEHEAEITMTLADGRTVSHHVKHASGSPENPLTDEALNTKFRAIVTPVLGDQRTEELLDAAWGLEEAPDIGQLMRLAGG